jgi:hypothetical protein
MVLTTQIKKKHSIKVENEFKLKQNRNYWFKITHKMNVFHHMTVLRAR